MVDKGNDEKVRGPKSSYKFFSKCVFGLICMWILLDCIS
jgi:hypothetical protein